MSTIARRANCQVKITTVDAGGNEYVSHESTLAQITEDADPNPTRLDTNEHSHIGAVGYEVDVSANDRVEVLQWLGGSMTASLPSFIVLSVREMMQVPSRQYKRLSLLEE